MGSACHDYLPPPLLSLVSVAGDGAYGGGAGAAPMQAPLPAGRSTTSHRGRAGDAAEVDGPLYALLGHELP